MPETLQDTASRERDNRHAELSLPSRVPMPTGEVEHRLMVLREGLIGGMSRPELVALAQQQWQVSRRTAYSYMQRLREQMMEEAREEDRSTVQQTSQAQRNRFLERVLQATRNYDLRLPDQVDMFIKLASFPGVAGVGVFGNPGDLAARCALQPGFPKTPTPATHYRPGGRGGGTATDTWGDNPSYRSAHRRPSGHAAVGGVARLHKSPCSIRRFHRRGSRSQVLSQHGVVPPNGSGRAVANSCITRTDLHKLAQPAGGRRWWDGRGLGALYLRTD